MPDQGHAHQPKPRLREQALISGVEALGDGDLLALLLGVGSKRVSVRRLAADLLETYGGLDGLSRAGPRELQRVLGLGGAKAARLCAAFELGARAGFPSPESKVLFDCFERVVEWALPRLARLEHEEVWLLVLDGKSRLKSVRRVALGGLHASSVTVQDILRPALRDGGSAILLVHNHPSGDPDPSPEDIMMTRTLQKACEAVGLPLLDHVIVARSGARSLFDNGSSGV